MYPEMIRANRWNGILFVFLLSGMFLYSLPALVRFASDQQLVWDKFAQGELLREFERDYDRQLFFREESIRQWANLQFYLFAEGAPGVVLGQQGWLFTGQEFLIPNDLSANIERQLQRIQNADSQLRTLGKQLVLMPVPMKVDIYSGYSAPAVSGLQQALYGQFVTSLQQAGIRVVPLRQAFLENREQGLFVPNDSHWTPEGARLAAAELGRALPQYLGSQDFVTRTLATEDYRGDLVSFIRFDPRLAPAYFAPWHRPVYETAQASASDADLFGDIDYRVALLGTSYSAMEAWHFPGFLQESMQQQLLTLAFEGAGPFKAMDEFLKGELSKSPALELVIWEFPVRTLLADREGQAGAF